MKAWFNSVWLWLKDNAENDPVRNCLVYNNIGCSHVDGYLCDMKTCSIVKNYKDVILENEFYK